MTAISQSYDRSYSIEEYLELEIKSGQKFEYYNGKLNQMAGGTIPHNRISRNMLTALDNALDDNFEAFGSDQKVFLPKYDFYVYPDAVVVANTPIESDKISNAIINPILIIEVLSPSTQEHDKGNKFIQYQSLPSFKEYVLIRQNAPEIQTSFREESDLWRTREFAGLDQQLFLRSVNLNIPISKIYKKVDLA